MDVLSETHASSALVNCEPAFLLPGSAPGAGGLPCSRRTTALHHLVRKSVRNMRRLLVAYIDHFFAFESTHRNPLLNKAPWIHFRLRIIDFQADSAIVLLHCWSHSESIGMISWEIRGQFSLGLDLNRFYLPSVHVLRSSWFNATLEWIGFILCLLWWVERKAFSSTETQQKLRICLVTHCDLALQCRPSIH